MRGVTASREWEQKDSDGTIVIAYSVAEGYPHEDNLDIFMAQFGKD